jgi:hypothetical protein
MGSNGSDDSFIELTLEARHAKFLWKTARLERLHSQAPNFFASARETANWNWQCEIR